MFSNALMRHDIKNATLDETKSQIISHSAIGSRLPNLCFQPPTHSSSKGQALRPTSQTILNGKEQAPLLTNAACKRTSSGLIKAVGLETRASFKTGSPPLSLGSQDDPLVLIDSPVKKQSVIEDNVVLYENDFDSDIDLDVENPITKTSVVHPSLPPLRRIKTPPKYPVLQKAGLHSQSNAKARHYEDTLPAIKQSPNSSAIIDWSSSPSEHVKAKEAGSASVPLNEPSITKMIMPLNPVVLPTPRTAAPKPSKRRTLPWIAESNKLPPVESSSLEPSPYAWNKSARTVKEEQKQLKMTTRATKTTDAVNDGSVPGALSRTKPSSVARIHLSEEQKHVIDLVVDSNKSVFFTGSAGTGKSVLLREIISVLRKKYLRETDRVAITASTGLAACNVGGVTLHSFAGIGLGKEDVTELVKKIKRNQKAKHRWMRTKILVIDEVSMVDGELFDKLEAVARSIRNNGRPFGGIQLVITGDFFQLPPVPDSRRAVKFCFDADTWNNVIDHTIGLHHVFRQKDPEFAGMLNEMREGKLSQKSISSFQKLSRALPVQYDMTATELFPTRVEVDSANNNRMQQLGGAVNIYAAKDGGAIVDVAQRDRLLANCMAPQSLQLKKGSQVMLIKNIDEMLVNGSLGKVIGFMSEVAFDQYDADEEGFLRVTNGVAEDDLDPKEQKMKRYLATATASSETWPLVRFTNSDGTTRDLLCTRETWKIELPNGEVQASRSQVPLILAWALSIHKAQGQTLERVKVDLGKVFEKGQAYVALSRATTMAGLQVLRFDPAKVMAHDRVRTFYAGLSRAEVTVKG